MVVPVHFDWGQLLLYSHTVAFLFAKQMIKQVVPRSRQTWTQFFFVTQDYNLDTFFGLLSNKWLFKLKVQDLFELCLLSNCDFNLEFLRESPVPIRQGSTFQLEIN